VAEKGARQSLEWGIATRACSGEDAAGDLAVVMRNAGGTIVAAIDGTGHGVEAAKAARAVAHVVRGHSGEDLFTLVVRCHEALRRTRGAAMSMAHFSEGFGVMTWLGIGNVEGRVFGADGADGRPKSALRPSSGVVGHELPSVTKETVDLRSGDVVVFTTDGIGASLADSLRPAGSAQAIADRIVQDHWKPTDDGLVLVVRYLA
jgi:phosphoserine phosphatase RsbX